MTILNTCWPGLGRFVSYRDAHAHAAAAMEPAPLGTVRMTKVDLGGGRTYTEQPRTQKGAELDEIWEQVGWGLWQPETLLMLDHHVDQSTVYIDVGAYYGVSLGYAGPRAGHSVGLEPDPKVLTSIFSCTWRDIRARESGHLAFLERGRGGK